MLQDAIFEKLVGNIGVPIGDKTHDVIWGFLRQSCRPDKEYDE